MADKETDMERIPEISEEKLYELGQRIKPLVSKGRNLFYIKPCHPRDTAFSWAPKRTKVATDLRKLTEITTYHTWGHYSLFKPSIAEVLAQIPEEYLDRCCAFVTEGPEIADDLHKHMDIFNEGYHVAITTLYEAERVAKTKISNRYKIAREKAAVA